MSKYSEYKIVVRITEEAMKVVRAKAKCEGTPLSIAADAIIKDRPVVLPELPDGKTLEQIVRLGISRHNALSKYAETRKSK